MIPNSRCPLRTGSFMVCDIFFFTRDELELLRCPPKESPHFLRRKRRSALVRQDQHVPRRDAHAPRTVASTLAAARDPTRVDQPPRGLRPGFQTYASGSCQPRQRARRVSPAPVSVATTRPTVGCPTR